MNIHLLNVGDADAIIIQLEKTDEKLTLLVDGGRNREHSNKIIEYFEDLHSSPQILICTHLDNDHIGGLVYALEKYRNDIRSIWLHIPQRHDPYFEAGVRVQMMAYRSERLEIVVASIDKLKIFLKKIEEYGLINKIFEPFSDSEEEYMNFCRKWGIKILGPSKQFYRSLLPAFRYYVPRPSEAAIMTAADSCSLIGKDGYDTPENESSLIFQISNDGKEFLFTGDAGLQSFEDIRGKLEEVYWLKVPHHGSKKNLNSEVMDILNPEKSFISAGGVAHPDREIVNCLISHGSEVKCTFRDGDLSWP
jgi:beta-lactamase superfamily II metal-dependent hydrolase